MTTADAPHILCAQQGGAPGQGACLTGAPIRLLLVDDHALFRSGVSALLRQHPEVLVVGEAADGQSGAASARLLQPDVVLLDLNMPGLSGLASLQLLRQQCPTAAVLMLTLSEDAADLQEALHQGACGYLIKSIDPAYLLAAIRRAAAGEIIVADAMAAKLVAHLQQGGRRAPGAADVERLTPRERDVFACLALGESNKVIARKLDVAESTVKIHVQSVLRKLNLSSRVHAAIFAADCKRAAEPGR